MLDNLLWSAVVLLDHFFLICLCDHFEAIVMIDW
jgi:hypothetical protein